MATHEEIRKILISHFPPGAEGVYDWDTPESDASQFIEALTDSLEQYAYSYRDTLVAEQFPQTASESLDSWLNALGLTGRRGAAGSDDTKRGLVLGRLREVGSFSPNNIKAVVGPILGYSTPGDLVIIEADRDALTDEHTRTGSAIALVGGGSFNEAVAVDDDPAVSKAGAQVYLRNFAASDVNDIVVSLTGPDSTVKLWTGGAGFEFPSSADPLILSAPEFADLDINGDWTLDVSSFAGDVSADSWGVFVEAVGRDSSGLDGRGAAAFEWAVLADPDLIGEVATADFPAARAAIQRIKPAHTVAYLVQRSTTGSDCAIWGDDTAIFDGALWC